MSLDEGRALLEMEEQLSSKEDVISRMSTEERQYHEVRRLHVPRGPLPQPFALCLLLTPFCTLPFTNPLLHFAFY
jgi:hypothetical protein